MILLARYICNHGVVTISPTRLVLAAGRSGPDRDVPSGLHRTIPSCRAQYIARYLAHPTVLYNRSGVLSVRRRRDPPPSCPRCLCLCRPEVHSPAQARQQLTILAKLESYPNQAPGKARPLGVPSCPSDAVQDCDGQACCRPMGRCSPALVQNQPCAFPFSTARVSPRCERCTVVVSTCALPSMIHVRARSGANT